MATTPDEIREFIALGREQQGVEFKGPGDRADTRFAARVVRGVLAMANRRDGGLVIIGVEDTGTELILQGLSLEQQGTWRHDHLADTVAEYADPRVSFETDLVEVDSVHVAVITVHEFVDMPVICKRTYSDGKKAILRDGAIYVRSHRKPESREVANYDEIRSLIEIAIDKEVRRFVTRAQKAGLSIGPGAPAIDSAKAYADERGGL